MSGPLPAAAVTTGAGLARHGLPNASFRGYAAHTRSPEFVTVMDALMHQAGQERTAVMCGEADLDRVAGGAVFL